MFGLSRVAKKKGKASLFGLCHGEKTKDEIQGYPTPENAILHLILHPILHPKPPVNTGYSGHWCRKCRIFSKNFFRREEMLHCGSCKTSDFFGQKYGCFASKVRMFASKKSDVFVFRKGGSIKYGFHSDLAESNMP